METSLARLIKSWVVPERTPKTITRCDPTLFSNIPEELRALPQWDCWKIIGGGLKPPVNPSTGQIYTEGTPIDRMGFSTFDEAVTCFKRRADVMGIGFRFKSTDPYTGIDSDYIRNPVTGELSDQGKKLLEYFTSTYCEVSVSGTGVHIFVKGKISTQVTKPVEMYFTDRYFTMTGAVLNGAHGVMEAQTELNVIYDVSEHPTASEEEADSTDLILFGIPLPEGVDFGHLLDEKGIRYKKRQRSTETSYDYHGLQDGTGKVQGCLIYGNVHVGRGRNAKESRFLVKEIEGERILSHQCFHSDCQCVENKTRRALKKLGINLELSTLGSVSVTPIEEKQNTGELLPYPIHVWKNTLYGDYADLMTRGNFIPAEFFVESLKTCVGAIIGDQIRCNQEGGNLRQYTVLIGLVGKGKGTATRRSMALFGDLPEEYGGNCDLLRQESAKSQLKKTGAVLSNAGSDVGLFYAASACPRVLLAPSEFSEFLSKSKIENSALPSIIRELFDSTWFTPTTTAKRKAAEMPRRCSLSMLTSTQLKTFSDALAIHGGLGSGLLSRLTLVSNEEKRTVAGLIHPIMGETAKHLFERIAELEENYETIDVSPEAASQLEAWWQDLQQKRDEEEDEEILTRLNVLTLRNALHLAWLHESVRISIDDMENAIALGEYQLAQRRALIVAAADNPLASHQMKILMFLKRHGPSTYRKIYRSIAGYRVGTELHGRALSGLVEGFQVMKAPTARKNQFLFYAAKESEQE